MLFRVGSYRILIGRNQLILALSLGMAGLLLAKAGFDAARIAEIEGDAAAAEEAHRKALAARETLGYPKGVAASQQALGRVDLRAPIVIRLDGTNAQEGRQILVDAGIPEEQLRSEPTMLDAAKAAVAIANGN